MYSIRDHFSPAVTSVEMLQFLVIEDAQDVAEAVSDALSEIGGAAVRCAGSGQAARHELQARRLDLALIDVMLPDTSGFELAEMAANRGVPVVMMSGHPRGQLTSEVCGYPYLHKPFSLSALANAARTAVRESRSNIAAVLEASARLDTVLSVPFPVVGGLVGQGLEIQARLLSDRRLAFDFRRTVTGGASDEQAMSVPGLPEPNDAPAALVRTWDGRIISWSPAMQRRYGFTANEAVGRLSHELLSSVFCQPSSDIEKQLSDRANWRGVLLHRRSDGLVLMTATHWQLHGDAGQQASLVKELHFDVVASGTQAGHEIATVMRSIAFELSQRLTAIGGYTGGARRELQHASEGDRARIGQAMAKTGNQIARASEILHLLRELARSLQDAAAFPLQRASATDTGYRARQTQKKTVYTGGVPG